MNIDELRAIVKSLVADALLRSYRGTVVAQDPLTFALQVQVPGMPLQTVPWTGAKYLVAPGATAAIQFDDRGQVELIGVTDVVPAVSSAVLGEALILAFNVHAHPSDGAPPATPLTPAILSTHDKVRS